MSSELDVDPALVADLLVRFLRAEAGKFGFSGAVLGLSGGIDSAVSAGLAARAFGSENVLCVMMPYRTSNPNSCLLYTSPSPRDVEESRMPSSA